MKMNWYIIHTHSNFEHKVVQSIRDTAQREGVADFIEDILVPTEQVVEVRRGKKLNAERKFLPGYVVIKMCMTDKTHHLIKHTPKVTGFLGSENKPAPIPEAEAMRIVQQVSDGVEKPRQAVTFEVGETIRVADGPFASFSGIVEEIDETRARLKVEVSIFGRATPVELDFGQVEKA